ncbi:ABC transporter permease [Alkalicaulis satelles]|uniref:ABC transporter permease n=1 Tax=Alkalicaulis satelles TaxID=2609175 RepID=A0A5M6ZMP9_9PROT|nr:ABC transporter permease [Alkalicaulis satelles]KAA5803561.1 ABC transporter permease [Alkalicaulis satelles]
MFKQTTAVTLLNLRSIPQRWGMSLATVLSIALVVGVLLGFMAMASGFRATVDGAGSDDVAIMLRGGAMAEMNSNVSRDEVRLLEAAPGIAAGAQGDPLISSELYVVADALRRTTGTRSNLALRGLGLHGPELRPQFSLVEGRMFEPGAAELVVGASVQREFEGFSLGETVRLGPNEWTVVGIFSTGGSVFDSEIWTDLGVVQNLYQRGSGVQTVRARLTSPDDIEVLREHVGNEPRLNLEVLTERDYFARSAGGTVTLIEWAGWPLAILMAIGALAGAWNAMYASVDARTRELATLRAIGFGGFPAFIAAMVEAIVLAFLGGLVGAGATWLLFDGVSASTLGSGFTQIVFAFAVTPGAAVQGVILAVIVGVLGGFVPAIRAARIPLLAVHAD